MSFYTAIAMRYFGEWGEKLSSYYTEVKTDLKRARMGYSIQEYISMAILTSLIVFCVEFPMLCVIFVILSQNPLFSFIFSFTISVFFSLTFFYSMMSYPKLVIRERAKEIDKILPFASVYLSTIAGSKVPLYKVFKIFSAYSEYGQFTEEINSIVKDVESFGMDINTALEKAVERSPSKNLRELLWGLLSMNTTGGDINLFLREKAKTFMGEYRRKLYEFSHQLTMFIEIYITAIILGAVFFTILSAIFSGLAGIGSNIIFLQFLIIFIFLPIVSVAFIFFVKSVSPGGE
ncbi:MAG: type II secretion system F family protein [Candidatus Aenigmarchaeota archaeon]|nr:type II secretion system F family protein [Candidatus Aenigmarchaeota archaeon]